MNSDWRIDKDDVLGTNCLRAVGELLARTDYLETKLREGANISIHPDRLPRRVSLAAQHLRDWGLNAEAEEIIARWEAFYCKWTKLTAGCDESVLNLLGKFNQWLGDRLRQWMVSTGCTELLNDREGNTVDQDSEHEKVAGRNDAQDGRTTEQREVAVLNELTRRYKEREKVTLELVSTAIGSSASSVKRTDAWKNRAITKESVERAKTGPTARSSTLAPEVAEKMQVRAASSLSSELCDMDLQPLMDELDTLGVGDLSQIITQLETVEPDIKEAAFDTVRENIKTNPVKAAQVLVQVASVSD